MSSGVNVYKVQSGGACAVYHNMPVDRDDIPQVGSIPILTYLKAPVRSYSELASIYPDGGEFGWFVYCEDLNDFVFWNTATNSWSSPTFSSSGSGAIMNINSIAGTDHSYTLAQAIAEVPELMRRIGLIILFNGVHKSHEMWVYHGVDTGSLFEDEGSWTEIMTEEDEEIINMARYEVIDEQGNTCFFSMSADPLNGFYPPRYIALHERKIGMMITFRISHDDWQMWQYNGQDIEGRKFTDKDNWKRVITEEDDLTWLTE